MDCPVCGTLRRWTFRHAVLNRHDVQYLFCGRCGLLQTEEPYWLEEAYAEPISRTDIGMVTRNVWLARRTAAISSAASRSSCSAR